MKIENDRQYESVKDRYKTNQKHGEGLLQEIKEYEGRERFHLYVSGEFWHVCRYPDKAAICGNCKSYDYPQKNAAPDIPLNNCDWRKITRTEAEYCQSKPEGEGWELREVVPCDEFVDATCDPGVIITASDAGLVLGRNFLSGKRWCRKPVEKKEPTALEVATAEIMAVLERLAEADREA